MSSISLLVDCKKIIQWLEDRKKLSKDWFNYVKAAQQKTKLLLKEKDDFNNYPQLLDHINQHQEHFCFFDVNTFTELLLKTDLVKQKSILFGYSDKRVKEWTNLKKFMESKNVGLLSNAKFIEQTLKFDLLGFDKNIEMMSTQLNNLKRKIDFNQNTIFQQQNEMKKEITTVGLELSENQDLRRFNIETQIPLIIGKVPETIKQIQNLVEKKKISKLVETYKQKVQKDGLECSLPVLEYFIQYKNDYVEVYKGLMKRATYQHEEKYAEFKNWRSVNEWQIVMENDNPSFIEELKLNSITLIEDRQVRQDLLYNLNELMYFYIGMKFEHAEGSKKLDVNHLHMTQGEIEDAISTLRQLIALLNSKKLLTPLELKNNKKSYQYFITKFHNIEKNIETLESQIQDYKAQIQQLERERNIEVEKLRMLRKKLIDVKKVQEKLLSELVAKEVKIVGEINKLQ